MIEDLKTSNMTVVQFLDELRDNKGHTSIIFLPGEDDLVNRNFTFFYDGDLLEYQVGTKRLVKAIVDGGRFAIRKDGKEYRGEKARALFKTDKEFKLWKRTIDDEKNMIIEDAVDAASRPW
jgi:two-component SAPR family response regulator